MFADWASKWAFKPGYGGVPGDVYDYFTLNAKSYPDTQPLMAKKGDFIRLRLIGAGEFVHSIHIHGHVFKVAFKDGHPLPNPYDADTISLATGERSEEHTSELQSLMRSSYADFCLTKINSNP